MDNPYQAPLAANSPPPLPASDEFVSVRQTYLKHEASVKGVASLYSICGLLVTLGGIASLSSNVKHLVPLSLMLLCMGLVSLVVGFALRRLLPWARIAAIVLSSVFILTGGYSIVSGAGGGIVGLAINLCVLILMASAKSKVVFSPYYRQVIAETPQIKYRTSPIVWIVLIVFLLVIVAIGVLLFLSTSGRLRG